MTLMSAYTQSHSPEGPSLSLICLPLQAELSSLFSDRSALTEPINVTPPKSHMMHGFVRLVVLLWFVGIHSQNSRIA